MSQQSLYRVTLHGMRDRYGTAYVVAADAGAAYQRVRADLDHRDLGFSKDREMHTVELIATDYEYTQLPRLYLPLAPAINTTGVPTDVTWKTLSSHALDTSATIQPNVSALDRGSYTLEHVSGGGLDHREAKP